MQTSPRVALTAALVGVAALVASAQQAAAPRGPLAPRPVLGGPVVTLDLPATDHGAFSTATTLLTAARVSFGAEGPANDPAVPLIDFAHAPDRSITLTGLTLGDALDAIVRANPRLRWAESDGLIVVRMTNRNSFLDRRLRQYTVMDAGVRVALEAFIRQLAPDRVKADGIAGMRSTTDQVAAQLPPREGRDVSLSLENPTVLDAMNAVARANGALSWVVRYDHAPATIETATISFNESRRIAVAGPPVAAAPATIPAGQPTLRIPVTGDVVTMLTAYARAAGVAVGVERIPALSPSPFRGSAPPLDLNGIAPEKAVARIVGHDSRYQWTDRSKRFLVSPKPGVGGAALLDTRLPSFVRSQEPFEAVIAGLIERLGVEDSRAQPIRPTANTLPAGTMDAARRRSVSVSLRRATTARDALDEVCRAAGGLSWLLRNDYSSNGRAQYRLEISSPEGWQYERTFSVPLPAASSTRTRAVAVPPDLDRDIARVYLGSAAASAGARLLALSSAARVPVGVEVTPSGALRDPRITVNASSLPTQLGPGRFSDALYAVLDRAPEYEMTLADGVINVAPIGAARQAGHFLNRRMGRFAVSAMPAFRVVALLRQRMTPDGGRELPAGGAPLTMGMLGIEQPITLDLENPTPREVLNAIAKQHGSLSWSVEYEGPGGEAGRVREEDCVLSLTPLRGAGALSLRFARDGSVAPPRPATAPLVAPAPAGAARATLSFPVNERSVEFSVIRVCRALGITCSVELQSEAPRRGPMGPPPGQTGTYDFTGMPGPQALDKLVTLIPNVMWKQDGPIFRVRSVSIAAAAELPFDRRVAVFDRQINSQNDIFAAVQGLLDSSRAGIGPVPSGTINFISSNPAASTERPFAVSLRDMTIRQILDELVRQHGAISWGVTYVLANGTYPELMLTLAGDSGGSGRGIFVR